MANPCMIITLANDYDGLEEGITELCTSVAYIICVVAEWYSGKEAHYAEKMLKTFARKGRLHMFAYFRSPAGESSKTLDVIEDLYEVLIKAHFDRKDILLALGGGVVGDMTGYAAATYLRGIRVIQLPTSLLAMVDSSIGGKTGVDFRGYKNMVGAFHQPSAVYMNVSTLKTLTKEQYFSGFGEIIKHGLIKDMNYFDTIQKNIMALNDRDLSALAEIIYGSCDIKRQVVENDPKEQGERALLNFGHTLGHAIEKLKNFELLHGECVAIGMVAASYLSYLRNMITEAQYRTICEMIQQMQLPTTVEGLTKEDIIRVSKNDKKMNAGQIRFILLDGLGNAVMTDDVTDEELSQALDAVITA